jgi:hypothetical protein
MNDLSDEILNANSVKEMVLSRLLSDGLITTEIAEEYAVKWQVIAIKPSLFKRWMNKYNREDFLLFKYVKFED